MVSFGIIWLALVAATTAQRFHVTGCAAEPAAGFICGALLAPGVILVFIGAIR